MPKLQPRLSLPSASVILCTIVLLGMRASVVTAQQPSAEARAKLFEEIADDVAELERRGNLLKKVVRLIKPTVVHIEAQKTTGAEMRLGRRPAEEAGSGVIVGIGGSQYIITNRHVIKNSALSQIKIQLTDGRLLNPTKVWSDKDTDVAVMSVAANNLVSARIGSSRNLDIGDFVLAVGSPFGLSHSVTYGIISAKGRRDLKLGDGVRYQDFMQTDAAINPGNSGGPLLNLRGEVIGINTAIASASGGNEGIGFTIPIDMAINVARQLVNSGMVVRAFLGVHLDSKFDALAATRIGLRRAYGAKVSGITPNSPAAAASLRVGDVITKFDSQEVEDDGHLVNLVSLTPVGTEVPVQIFREGAFENVAVTVGDRDKFEP